jgi:hypothetical protein
MKPPGLKLLERDGRPEMTTSFGRHSNVKRLVVFVPGFRHNELAADAVISEQSGITAAAVRSDGWTDAFAGNSAEAFSDALADDVVLEGTTLRRPVEGRDQVVRVMRTASGIYESLLFTHEASSGARTYLPWEATALGGLDLRGVTILTKDGSGQVIHAAIHHRPLGVALRFSAELRKRLTGMVDPGYFYEDDDVFASDGVQRAGGLLGE